MATQVTYKNNQIASFANGTRILKTSGKYMEDDVTIVADSGEASAITIVDELDSHGGIIRHINGVVLTGDTITSSVLLQGYTAHDGTGQAITGSYVPPSAATLGTKSISTNGTYNASSDSLDGYSSVSVNVPTSLEVEIYYDDETLIWRPSKTYTEISTAYQNNVPILLDTSANANPVSGYFNNLDSKFCYTVWDFGAELSYTLNSDNSISELNSSYYYDTSGATISSNSQLASGIKAVGSDGTLYTGTGSSGTYQAKTNINPSTSSQTITADNGYDALSSVQINAMPSGTAGTPTATKGTVSNHSISVTPSVTNTTGYITGGTKTGTAVTVSASELVSGTKSISANGTAIDVTNYASVDVAVPGAVLQAKTGITPTESSQTITADNGYDGLSSVQINAISSTYVGSGIAQRTSSNLSANGAVVTVPAGYYASQATKSVDTMTLPTSTSASATSGYTSKATVSRSTSDQYINIPPGYNGTGGYYKISAVANMTLPTSASASATSGYTSKATISRSTSDQYINIPTGYNTTGAYYKISAVANGSATNSGSASGSSATVSTGTNTITLTKSVSITPTVSAGYISSGTAGNVSVALTASVTTKAAATITPTTTNQTIASGTYLTGTQTISGDANLVGSNIISGVSIFGVSGSVVIQHYYTGSSAPSSSLGENGDIYLKTS